jgi:hypothetical protein
MKAAPVLPGYVQLGLLLWLPCFPFFQDLLANLHHINTIKTIEKQ